jgi:hypothetical protein
MSPLALEHMRACHADGSECLDGCDAVPLPSFCAQCGSTPCSCHLCSECGDELAGGAGGRCLNCNPLHSRECRCEECSDDNDVAYNAWKDGQL